MKLLSFLLALLAAVFAFAFFHSTVTDIGAGHMGTVPTAMWFIAMGTAMLGSVVVYWVGDAS